MSSMRHVKPGHEPDMPDAYREVVLVQHEMSKKAHQELFSFDDSRYVMIRGSIVESLVSLAGQGIARIHIAADWEHLLMTALWTSARPRIFDVITLLKKSGATEAELAPFATSDINDLFPWLYYGKRFDMLRKICNTAKAKAESGTHSRHPHIICHLVADDTSRIVASSL